MAIEFTLISIGSATALHYLAEKWGMLEVLRRQLLLPALSAASVAVGFVMQFHPGYRFILSGAPHKARSAGESAENAPNP